MVDLVNNITRAKYIFYKYNNIIIGVKIFNGTDWYNRGVVRDIIKVLLEFKVLVKNNIK